MRRREALQSATEFIRCKVSDLRRPYGDVGIILQGFALGYVEMTRNKLPPPDNDNEDDDDGYELDEQEKAWGFFFRKLHELMGQFGRHDAFGDADYLIVDDNYGYWRSHVEVHRLHMLEPRIVAEVQKLVSGHPDWTVVMAVSVPGTEGRWPPMGLTIRAHETIDGLKREYLPEPYRSYRYEGSRPGTGYD